MSIGLTASPLSPKLTPAYAQAPGAEGSSGKIVLAPATTRTSDLISSSAHAPQISPSSTAATFDALDTATALTDSASAAGGIVIDSLAQIRRAVAVATDSSVNAPQRAALASGYQALVARIQAAVSGAGFDGANLLAGASSTAGVTFPTDAGGSTSVTLRGADLTPGGGVVTLAPTADLSTPESSRAVLSEVDASTTAVHAVLGRIDAQGRSLAAHADAVANLSSAGSAGDTSDADAAGLLALQVRQQLGLQGVSLVARTPGSILNLFKDRAA